VNGPRPPLFDAHLHVIDPRFPLVPNGGYLPPAFTVADYQARTAQLDVIGGAVVSGSFQAFDQTYLLAALAELGPGFVGVTQLPASVPDEQVVALAEAGVSGRRRHLRLPANWPWADPVLQALTRITAIPLRC
jgi:predicted TIM-barrel fold metal-dependent hydrolase